MCYACMAAGKQQDGCPEVHMANGSSVPSASSGTVVNDERSILFYLDGGPNFRWNANDATGTPVMLTYSFASNATLPSTSGSSNPYGATSFSSFTETQKQNFRIAAAEFMAVSGLILVETTGDGDIDIFNASGTSVGGYADLPYVNGGYQSDVELVIDNGGSYAPGTYGYYTLLHELGHAVGLDHTHDGAYVLNASLDTTRNTVMSYNYDASVMGLQSIDVAALQNIYGGAAISAGFSFSYEAQIARLYATGSNGADSYTGVANVKGTAIANKVFGMGGNDAITGHDAVDILRGNMGNDSLNGKGGSDFLRGGEGDDILYGEAGDDYLNGGAGDDTIYGGSGNDQLLGNSGADILYGQSGNDTLSGKKNSDILDGGQGYDILSGGEGNDTFVFRADSGSNKITDFDTNGEKLQFVSTGFNFSDVTTTSIASGAQVQVGAVVIELVGVDASTIDATDFDFI